MLPVKEAFLLWMVLLGFQNLSLKLFPSGFQFYSRVWRPDMARGYVHTADCSWEKPVRLCRVPGLLQRCCCIWSVLLKLDRSWWCVPTVHLPLTEKMMMQWVESKE